jgi:hypothetical protein
LIGRKFHVSIRTMYMCTYICTYICTYLWRSRECKSMCIIYFKKCFWYFENLDIYFGLHITSRRFYSSIKSCLQNFHFETLFTWCQLFQSMQIFEKQSQHWKKPIFNFLANVSWINFLGLKFDDRLNKLKLCTYKFSFIYILGLWS